MAAADTPAERGALAQTSDASKLYRETSDASGVYRPTSAAPGTGALPSPVTPTTSGAPGEAGGGGLFSFSAAEPDLATIVATDVCNKLRGIGLAEGVLDSVHGAVQEVVICLDARALAAPAGAGVAERPDLVAYLRRQWTWSKETFGPALRTKGVVQHIRKELVEIEAEPHDLAEWVDVIILAMDGFWRHGGRPEDLLPVMQAKQDKNFARTWPDWRTMGEDRAIEHDRSGDLLKLEEGKCYRNGRGDKVGPVYQSNRDHGIWYSRTKAAGGDWYIDGRALHGLPAPDTSFDLVAEWIAAAPAPAVADGTGDDLGSGAGLPLKWLCGEPMSLADWLNACLGWIEAGQLALAKAKIEEVAEELTARDACPGAGTGGASAKTPILKLTMPNGDVLECDHPDSPKWAEVWTLSDAQGPVASNEQDWEIVERYGLTAILEAALRPAGPAAPADGFAAEDA